MFRHVPNREEVSKNPALTQFNKQIANVKVTQASS